MTYLSRHTLSACLFQSAATILAGVLILLLSSCGRNESGSQEKDDIERMKRENEDLRARFAKLETAQQKPANPPDPKTNQASPSATPKIQPLASWTPEQILRAYWAVERWEDRLPLVLNSETVRPVMTEYYKRFAAIHRKTIKIQHYSVAKISVGDELVVKVDTGDDTERPYYMVRTADGYRIDWLKSIAESVARENAKNLRDWGLENAVMEVGVLRVRRGGGPGVIVTIEVANKSKAMLGYYELNVSFYDGKGSFLGNGRFNGSNLRPDSSTTKDIYIDVGASDVSSWKLKLGEFRVEKEEGQMLSGAEKYFKLREIK